MAELPQSHLRLTDLPNTVPTDFALVPTAPERQAVAETLGIEAVKKLRLAGRISPLGDRDWQLTADLGATVVQSCVISLAPVTTRIDEKISRNYLADLPEPDGSEVEMPEDDTAEALPDTLDLGAVLIEALALALPIYPRNEGANLDQTAFSAPGTPPMTDEEAKPFAGLAALRDSLENKGD